MSAMAQALTEQSRRCRRLAFNLRIIARIGRRPSRIAPYG
jgi:hypothetical protein